MDKNPYKPLRADGMPVPASESIACPMALGCDLSRIYRQGRMDVLKALGQPALVEFLNKEALSVSP
jgi:hypothetical protein